MISSYRLESPLQVQREKLEVLQSKKILFLSLEGTVTERKYFEYLNYKIQKGAYNIIIDIEILKHNKKDGKSSVQHVLRRLEACKRVCESENIDDVKTDCMDTEYKMHIQSIHTEDDCFAIVVDRDKGSHSEEGLREVISRCRENNCNFYLSNPCFEFWLLMHVCDIKNEYEDLNLFLENEKISSKHTYTSNELSKKVSHGKNFSLSIFEKTYFPNIPTAIEQSKTFAILPEELLTNIGSNLYHLMNIIGVK